MKKLYTCFIFFFLATCSLTFTGCDEDGNTDCELFGDCGGNGGGGGGGGSNGQVVFWNNQSWVGTITVTLGSNSSQVTQTVNSTPSCGQSGCATFYGSPGSYPYYASATTGETWNGSATIYSGSCSTLLLY